MDWNQSIVLWAASHFTNFGTKSSRRSETQVLRLRKDGSIVREDGDSQNTDAGARRCAKLSQD